MRTFLPLLVSLALSGNYITKPPATGYGATLAPMTADVIYYADSVNGLDTNPCTSGLPCKTIKHVQTLIPLVMDFNATIYLAAGTYDEVLTFANMDRGLGAAKSITLQGQSWAAFTPATGPQTGTFTSGSGRVATMASATWTVNDLRGSHVKITSGTKSGNYYPIASNTVDGVSIPVSSSDMTAISTATFEIVRPAAIISHAAISGYTPALIEISGNVMLNFSSIAFDGTNFVYCVRCNPSSIDIWMSRCRFYSFGLYAVSSTSTLSTTLDSSVVVVSGSLSGIYAYQPVINNSTIAGTSSGKAITVALRVSTSQAILDGSATGVYFIGNVSLGTSYCTGLDITSATTGVKLAGLTTLVLYFSAGTWSVDGVGIDLDTGAYGSAQIWISGTVVTSGSDAVRISIPYSSIALAGAASLTSSAGYGANLAYADTTAASGAFNNLHVGASASISGFTADINLGDSTTSLAALRALPGKVLVGATTMNRAISF
jgi:hypothetical protein